MQEMKARDAHLDLLRIVSMLLIILLHSIDHSGVLEQADSSSGAMYFYVRFLYAAAQVCVNCYVMLSGYYLVESRFRLQKLVALWMEVAFYSFTFKALFMLTGQSALSPVSLLACFFPIVTGRYWFITIYVGMYAIFPFLNRLIHAMKKTEHAALNLCLFVLLSLWVSIHPAIAGMNSGGGWGLTWFVALYLAAAWLRLYYKPSYKAGLWFAVALIIPLIMAGAAAVLGGGTNVPVSATLLAIVKNWFRYDSAPVYGMTVALFLAFLNMRVKNAGAARLCSYVSPLTLGVYLIHAHANVSPWLWELLALPEKMDSAAFPLVQFGCVLGIFALCAAIDALRRATVGRLERSTALNNTCQKLTAKADALLVRLCA